MGSNPILSAIAIDIIEFFVFLAKSPNRSPLALNGLNRMSPLAAGALQARREAKNNGIFDVN
jgi:hypothetical protein